MISYTAMDSASLFQDSVMISSLVGIYGRISTQSITRVIDQKILPDISFYILTLSICQIFTVNLNSH